MSWPIGRSCENFDCFALTSDARKSRTGRGRRVVVRGPGSCSILEAPEARQEPEAESRCTRTSPTSSTALVTSCACSGWGLVPVPRASRHMVKTRGYRVDWRRSSTCCKPVHACATRPSSRFPTRRSGRVLRAAVVGGGRRAFAQELASTLRHQAAELRDPRDVRADAGAPDDFDGRWTAAAWPSRSGSYASAS